MAQSDADSLRMDLAEVQTTEAALRSTLGDTEGQVRRLPQHLQTKSVAFSQDFHRLNRQGWLKGGMQHDTS